jgi:hypothetical protein
MVTWHLDRWLRSGPLCALATFFVPAALAIPVAATSDVNNVFALLLVSSLVMFIGSATGSAPTIGAGIALFIFASYIAEISVVLLAAVGIGLFATLVLHDLAGAFHRAPRIGGGIWRSAAVTVALVSVAAAAASTVTYLVATAATWRAIVVPFGLAAVGFSFKLAADSHAKSAEQLTRKRKKVASSPDDRSTSPL